MSLNNSQQQEQEQQNEQNFHFSQENQFNINDDNDNNHSQENKSLEQQEQQQINENQENQDFMRQSTHQDIEKSQQEQYKSEHNEELEEENKINLEREEEILQQQKFSSNNESEKLHYDPNLNSNISFQPIQKVAQNNYDSNRSQKIEDFEQNDDNQKNEIKKDDQKEKNNQIQSNQSKNQDQVIQNEYEENLQLNTDQSQNYNYGSTPKKGENIDNNQNQDNMSSFQLNTIVQSQDLHNSNYRNNIYYNNGENDNDQNMQHAHYQQQNNRGVQNSFSPQRQRNQVSPLKFNNLFVSKNKDNVPIIQSQLVSRSLIDERNLSKNQTSPILGESKVSYVERSSFIQGSSAKKLDGSEKKSQKYQNQEEIQESSRFNDDSQNNKNNEDGDYVAVETIREFHPKYYEEKYIDYIPQERVRQKVEYEVVERQIVRDNSNNILQTENSKNNNNSQIKIQNFENITNFNDQSQIKSGQIPSNSLIQENFSYKVKSPINISQIKTNNNKHKVQASVSPFRNTNQVSNIKNLQSSKSQKQIVTSRVIYTQVNQNQNQVQTQRQNLAQQYSNNGNQKQQFTASKSPIRFQATPIRSHVQEQQILEAQKSQKKLDQTYQNSQINNKQNGQYFMQQNIQQLERQRQDNQEDNSNKKDIKRLNSEVKQLFQDFSAEYQEPQRVNNFVNQKENVQIMMNNNNKSVSPMITQKTVIQNKSQNQIKVTQSPIIVKNQPVTFRQEVYYENLSLQRDQGKDNNQQDQKLRQSQDQIQNQRQQHQNKQFREFQQQNSQRTKNGNDGFKDSIRESQQSQNQANQNQNLNINSDRESQQQVTPRIIGQQSNQQSQNQSLSQNNFGSNQKMRNSQQSRQSNQQQQGQDYFLNQNQESLQKSQQKNMHQVQHINSQQKVLISNNNGINNNNFQFVPIQQQQNQNNLSNFNNTINNTNISSNNNSQQRSSIQNQNSQQKQQFNVYNLNQNSGIKDFPAFSNQNQVNNTYGSGQKMQPIIASHQGFINNSIQKQNNYQNSLNFSDKKIGISQISTLQQMDNEQIKLQKAQRSSSKNFSNSKSNSQLYQNQQYQQQLQQQQFQLQHQQQQQQQYTNSFNFQGQNAGQANNSNNINNNEISGQIIIQNRKASAPKQNSQKSIQIDQQITFQGFLDNIMTKQNNN
ncbi:hypothetical protein PPERSA_12713 [Pseudocohnilembus persalinus]|uniref:Uncharacterized protein n=1 Tax=Pseudocohnilembus persalinus TaxID=266149 RepID=A0A0V0QT85_PSEPJ|nr:hypothetical protein PPERSA_12713 [Pseudocohnilembus persalinus]|eukprot:KRX05535.1 hypothetical protein PPERSA_12713 [Pseudocohnilembus persalinus]